MLEFFFGDFIKGLKEYNNKQFFECHDTWEEIWHDLRGTDRLFLQGLIHSTIGHYHLRNHNWKGAYSQFQKCQNKLEPYSPTYFGLDIMEHLSHIKQTAFPLIDRMKNGEPVTVQDKDYPTFDIPKYDDTFKSTLQFARNQVELKTQIKALQLELSNSQKKNDLLKTELEDRLKFLEENYERKLKTVWVPLSLLVGFVFGVTLKTIFI